MNIEPVVVDLIAVSDIEVQENHFSTFKTLLGKLLERPNLLGVLFQETETLVTFPILVKFCEFSCCQASIVTTGTYQKIMELLELHHKIPAATESSLVQSPTDEKARRLTQETQSHREALLALKRYLSYFPFANFYVFQVSSIVSRLTEFQKLVEKMQAIPTSE